MSYDSILVVSFGGPEKPDDVLPFLENVLRGKNVPRERMLQVAEHYYHFGGKSPINDSNRGLIAALREELNGVGVALPIYWGNRNWHPLLADTLREMRANGHRRALAFVTSAYSSYSGCRQYREDIAGAQAEGGDGAPEVHKLRVFYNHPGFIEAMADRVAAALARFEPSERESAGLFYTAHSIPLSMAETSAYREQLAESCRLVSERLGRTDATLVYQSRSGPPSQPWLEPDVLDTLRDFAAKGGRNVVLAPIGFLSDHMEVLYDLDTEARDLAADLGLHLERAGTAGTHPAFVRMIRELICERIAGSEKRAIGRCGPNHDICPENCCPAPVRRPAPVA